MQNWAERILGKPQRDLEVGLAPRRSSGPLQTFFPSQGSAHWFCCLGVDNKAQIEMVWLDSSFLSHLEMNRALIDMPTCVSSNKTRRPRKTADPSWLISLFCHLTFSVTIITLFGSTSVVPRQEKKSAEKLVDSANKIRY